MKILNLHQGALYHTPPLVMLKNICYSADKFLILHLAVLPLLSPFVFFFVLVCQIIYLTMPRLFRFLNQLHCHWLPITILIPSYVFPTAPSPHLTSFAPFYMTNTFVWWHTNQQVLVSGIWLVLTLQILITWHSLDFFYPLLTTIIVNDSLVQVGDDTNGN